MMRLFTSVYSEKSEKRRTEIQECLQRNLACSCLDAIHVLAEGEPRELPKHRKLSCELINHRPNYSDFFAAINRVANKTDISIVANSDIWFDASIKAAELYLTEAEVWALSRWQDSDDLPAVLYDRKDSQDSWIFRGQARQVAADFPVGVPRCDNRLLAELEFAGYVVRNPAFSIRSYHRHAEARAAYPNTGEDFVSPPYTYLSPHNFAGPFRTVWHKFKYPGIPLGWRFDKRRFRQWLPVRAILRLKSISKYVRSL